MQALDLLAILPWVHLTSLQVLAAFPTTMRGLMKTDAIENSNNIIQTTTVIQNKMSHSYSLSPRHLVFAIGITIFDYELVTPSVPQAHLFSSGKFLVEAVDIRPGKTR